MLPSRTTRLALLTLLGTILAAASITPAASAAAQRYASPTGTGTACSSASPCSIRQAVEHAGSNDEVIVAPGDYPLTGTLATPAAMTIHGVAGQPRPRLLFSGVAYQRLEVLYGSTLRYVEVVQAPGNDWPALVAVQSTVDQVIAKGSGYKTAVINASLIRNSIVVSSRGDAAVAVAIETSANGANSVSTYRNVTAIATGSSGVAIRAWGYDGYAGILLRNVIARGGPGGHDLVARAVNAGTTAKITVGNSNWLVGSTDGAGASIVDGGGNQTSAPAFVNAAAGDYRQAPGSPTIDAGLDEAINGAFDVEGDPRQVGGIDIGADEFVAAPAATTGPAGAVTEQSATLSGSVDANGIPTSYHFEYGLTSAYGSTTPLADAGSGGAVAATASLSGLTPATTYHFRIVATSAGGVTQGADRTFTTASPPQPAPASPPSTPAAPPADPAPTTPTATTSTATQAFAGVRLVSTRLRFARRRITLKLTCPAGTVGRCSGRTKLTARPRRTSSPAGSPITLGRATFSIAGGQRARVRVRVSRAGRRRLGGVRRLRAGATNVAHSGAGESKTTVAAVTIRRRHR